MALSFSRLAYLGDSLTDTGTLYDLTRTAFGVGLPLSPPYAEAVSNGPVHADLAPDLLGVSGDLNFAVAAAEAGADRRLRDYISSGDLGDLVALADAFGGPEATAALDTRIDLAAQTERLLAATSGDDRGEIAASILIGANDLNFSPADATEEAVGAAITDALTGIGTSAATLLGSGFAEVFVYTLPGGAFFPAVTSQGAGVIGLAGQITDGFNAGLEALAATTPGVTLVDFGLMADEAAADATAFGFRDATTTALSSSVAGLPEPTDAFLGVPNEQLMFWDPLHPTEELHALFAAFTAEAIRNGLTEGTSVAEALFGSGADDLILALDGNDSVGASGGDDVVLAGLGDDEVSGQGGNDIVIAGSGNDAVRGQSGADLLGGNGGDDDLRGGTGDDILVDGAGSDTARGGRGDDLFVFTEEALFGRDGGASDDLRGGGGDDTLIVRLTVDTVIDVLVERLGGGDGRGVLSGLGVEIRGIEDIRFVGRDRTPEVDVSGAQEILLSEAEHWNLI